MDWTAFSAILPQLAGGSALALIFVAVWFANSSRRIAVQADSRYEREVKAHEQTRKMLDEEREHNRVAKDRIRQLEWDVRVLKHELSLVKGRVSDLEDNGT